MPACASEASVGASQWVATVAVGDDGGTHAGPQRAMRSPSEASTPRPMTMS